MFMNLSDMLRFTSMIIWDSGKVTIVKDSSKREVLDIVHHGPLMSTCKSLQL